MAASSTASAAPAVIDATLTAAQRSKIRRLAAPVAPDASEEAGELNIVPFLDIITNVLMFVLASLSVSFVVTLDVQPPHGTSRRRPNDPIVDEGLNLAVVLGADGYYVKGNGGALAPGCRDLGAGVTVAMTAATGDESTLTTRYDSGGLQRCARALKDDLVAHGKAERQVMLTANPNVPFQELVRAMDALRRDEGGELFPDVVFSVVK